MIPASPFSPKTPDAGAPAQDNRRRRLMAAQQPQQPVGLAALAQGGETFENTSDRPQQIGQDADLALQEPELPKINQAPELNQPSMLATERVERAPATADARPLLSNEDRFGASLSELIRGEEEGSPAPGATRGIPSRERQAAVARFLRPEAQDTGSEEAREALGMVSSGANAGARLASGLRSLAQPTARERLMGVGGSASNWSAENALREAVGARPFTETFEDPRFPGMKFPSSGGIEGVDTTPAGSGDSGVSLGGVARGAQEGLGGVMGAASLVRAIIDLQEGRLPQGGLGALAGIGSLLKTAGGATAPGGLLSGLGVSPGVSSGLGTAGGALGSIAGLAGAGLSAANGQIPQAIISALQGALSTAGLVAPGAMTGLAANAAASAAAGSSAAASGASVAPALAAAPALMAAPLAIVALGAMLHPLWEELDKPNLATRNERRNIGADVNLSTALLNAMNDKAPAGSLLALAGIGPKFGQGQVQFAHDKFGFGGDYDDPMSDTFKASLENAAKDPQALRDFISGIGVYRGNTGATQLDEAMTDYYRRELASRAGITDPTGLFRKWDPLQAQEQGIGTWEDRIPALQQLLGDGVTSIDEKIGPRHGVSGSLHIPVSQKFRAPGELQAPAAKRYDLGQLLESLLRDKKNQEQLMAEAANSNIGGG